MRKVAAVDATSPNQAANGDAYQTRGVHRVCDVLDALKLQGKASLSEVAKVSGMHRSTALRYLTTLEARRYVARDPITGKYTTGTALSPVPLFETSGLISAALPYLREIRDELDETVNLGCLDGTEILYLFVIESRRGIRMTQVAGMHDPLYCTALGKAIASVMDKEALERVLDVTKFEPRTANTITDRSAFYTEIEEVTHRGYALDDGENEEHARCIAVPLRLPWIDCALSLSGPAQRLPLAQVDTIVSHLQRAADAIVGGVPEDPLTRWKQQ